MSPPEEGVPPEEAFELLGHETRLGILHALWEEHGGEGPPPDSPVTFTTLRKHVGMRDGSQFNYHLDKLTGRFIGKTDQGYFLRRSGYRIIQTVLSGTGINPVSVSPQPFEFDCEYCGAETVIGYHDEYLYHACTECVGSFDLAVDELAIPASASETGGLLGLFGVDPNWTAAGHTMDVSDLYLRETYQTIQKVLTRLCDSCAGKIHGTVDICDDHEASSDSLCQTCDRRYRVRALYECSSCEEISGMPPGWVVVYHPVTVQFAFERGMVVGQPNDPESLRDTYEVAQSAEVAVSDEQAPEITVDFTIDPDVLRFRLDAELNVLDIDERALVDKS